MTKSTLSALTVDMTSNFRENAWHRNAGGPKLHPRSEQPTLVPLIPVNRRAKTAATLASQQPPTSLGFSVSSPPLAWVRQDLKLCTEPLTLPFPKGSGPDTSGAHGPPMTGG